MKSEMYSQVEDWKPISPRIIMADIQLSVGKSAFLQAYAPTEDASALDKEMYYTDLERKINQCRDKSRNIILIGDFNARIGLDHSTWCNGSAWWGKDTE